MTAEDQLQQIARHHFEQSYEAFPVRATTLGIHTYDHTLGTFDASTIASQVERLQESQAALSQIDVSQLNPDARIDFELLDSDIKLALAWHTQTREWEHNPNFYAETPVYGVFMLTVREFAPVQERARNVIARLEDVPKVLDAARANIKNPPRVYTDIAIETTEDGISFFQNAIPGFATAIPQLEQQLLLANQKAIDAYTHFLSFLRSDLLPRSRGKFAVGRAHYEERLRLEHALSITAPELKRTGQKLFDDTERRLIDLATRIDIKKTWRDIAEEAKAEHPSADRLIQTYAAEIARLRSFVADEGIVTIPQNEVLEVTPTPSFARSTLPYAAYFPPAPFDERQEGQFWVTPLDERAAPEDQEAQLREHSYFALPAIALHEAYPGHHVQLVHSNNASSYIRKHISSNIMCEGWAFYCEELMHKAGYRPVRVESSPDPDFAAKLFQLFILKDALWRAARIIIDVGLHTEGMEVEEAVKLLTDRVFLSRGAAIAEVRRYTLSPTQPMSYAIGKQQILSLRQELPNLPMHQFHDALLSEGTIAVSYVRERMLAKLK